MTDTKALAERLRVENDKLRAELEGRRQWSEGEKPRKEGRLALRLRRGAGGSARTALGTRAG